MNTPIRSLLISTALLVGAAGSFAASPDSDVESLVKATLTGQNILYPRGAFAPRDSSALNAAAGDAAAITRQVLRGESTVPAARHAVDASATTAQAEPAASRSDSWRLAQKLLGKAG